jgi:hypothetical protein
MFHAMHVLTAQCGIVQSAVAEGVAYQMSPPSQVHGAKVERLSTSLHHPSTWTPLKASFD